MTTQLNDNSKNGGLLVLVMLLRFQGIAAEAEHIRHQFRGTPIGIAEMLRYAKQRGIKARVSTTDWSRLSKVPLPAIAALNDGGFLILAKSGDNKILVQDPNSQRPQLMTRAELEAIWNGCIILMTRRTQLTDLSRRFDLSWFVGAIHKYRRLLGEVLVGSFFLQVLHSSLPCYFGSSLTRSW